jgi:cysteine desulfurase
MPPPLDATLLDVAERVIYMDDHATTPVDPRVLDAMLPYFGRRGGKFGNAASRSHVYGWTAEQGVGRARRKIADLIGAQDPKEIVFTSGATESDNLAVKGIAESYRDKGDHIITTPIEHKAVLDSCKRLEKDGYRITYLPIGREGVIDPGDVARAITRRTLLVSVMLANNETGAVQPIVEIGKITRARGVLLHTDAVQGVGKVPFDVASMGVDLASLSAHKMYGPKGVGALYVRRAPEVRLTAQMDGGGHELGMRSGTLNVPGIVGFGEAADIMHREGVAEARRVLALRERLRRHLQTLDAVQVNGSLRHRLPGNLNVSFSFVDGEALMVALQGVAVSSGSACTSASLEPSYVLRAMGLGEEARSSIRFGLGRFTTLDEVDEVAARVIDKVSQLREQSPRYRAQAGPVPSLRWF